MNLNNLWNYAYTYCLNNGLNEDNLKWWRNLPKPCDIDDHYFLSELTWCIYNAGMKEKVVRMKWDELSSIFQFFDYESIILCEEEIMEMIVPVFNHKGKAKAVIEASKKIKNDSPIKSKFASMNEEEALKYLASYPYIGNITKYHIARNIGFDVVKPDRHLVRITEFLNYESPDKLVSDIAIVSGEKKGFIDYILWQWLAWEGNEAYNSLYKEKIIT